MEEEEDITNGENEVLTNWRRGGQSALLQLFLFVALFNHEE
jgi:hypothetical protein